MKTLVVVEKQEEEEEEQSTTMSTTDIVVNNPSSKKTNHDNLSIPIEILEDILSRLPVESILRSTSVSKAWLSLISHPSFSRLQLTHATSIHRTALFISAYDVHTGKCHYLSASSHGGPLTLLMTVDKATRYDSPSHLNGLVCFTSHTWVPGPAMTSQAFVVNPSTRRVFKLAQNNKSCVYLYGFDKSQNQHKILLMKREIMVFDMSSRSWRNIDEKTPVDFTWDDIQCYMDVGVCFNSKLHVMLQRGTRMFDILAFDFVTEKFSLISIPQDVWPHIWVPGEVGVVRYRPFIMKINGCLGFVVCDYKRGAIHIWLLQDHENGVWVKETIPLPKPWNALAFKFHLSIDANMDDEIVFNITKFSGNVMTVPVYNMKSKSFRSLEFTLDGQVLSSKTMKFYHIKHYVDSMVLYRGTYTK